MIAERFPGAQLTGIDISKEAVACGRRYMREAGLEHVTIEQGTFDSFNGSYDVILSAYSLCCSPPSEIGGVLDRVIRSAKHVLIIEPSGEGPSTLLSTVPTWAHDYAAMLRDRGMNVQIEPVKMGKIGRVVLASRQG